MIVQLLHPLDLLGLPEHIEESLECGHARCIAFNPAGTLLAAGCEEGQVVIWDCLTRGVVRVYAEGPRRPIVFVGWGHSGRRLFSASADGRLVVRDMLTGEQLAAVELGQAVVNACLDPADESQLLVSLAQGPARFVDLHTGRQTLLPAFVLETRGKGAARVLRDPPDVVQLAVLSCCRQLVFAATKGAVAVHRRSDLALLDMVLLHTTQQVQMMSHGEKHKAGWLLVVSQDKAVRGYAVAEGAHSAQPHDPEELQAVSSGKVPKPGSSLLRSEGSLLSFQRQFQDPMEKKPWGCAAFDPDMEHVCAGMSTKHVIHRWQLEHGTPEGVLEGGTGAVVAMAWHPRKAPLELWTLSATGTIYVWTRIQHENWACFATDFEELTENREYVEREDEFDLNPRPEDDADMAAPSDEDDGEVDILGGAITGGGGHTAGGAGESSMQQQQQQQQQGAASSSGGEGWGGEEGALTYLPVTLADIEAARERQRQQEQGDAGQLAAGEAGGPGVADRAAGGGGSPPRQQNSGAPSGGEAQELSEGGKRKRRG